MLNNKNLTSIEATVIDRPSVSQDIIIESDHGFIHELFFEGSNNGTIDNAYRIYFPDYGNWYLIEAGYNADDKAWINFHYCLDNSGMKHYSITAADITGTPVSDIVREVLNQEFHINYEDIPSFIRYLKASLSIVDYDGLVDPETDPEYESYIEDDTVILTEDDLSEE